jgi:hypothetical protein
MAPIDDDDLRSGRRVRRSDSLESNTQTREHVRVEAHDRNRNLCDRGVDVGAVRARRKDDERLAGDVVRGQLNVLDRAHAEPELQQALLEEAIEKRRFVVSGHENRVAAPPETRPTRAPSSGRFPTRASSR